MLLSTILNLNFEPEDIDPTIIINGEKDKQIEI